METRLLHYFIVLTRIGNITKAANELHITQPTLSRQLKDLEDEVGTQLFIRGKRSITLTDAGVLFEQRAKTMLDFMEQTKQDLHSQHSDLAGNIRIGCVESKVSKYVAAWIASFQKQHPNITFSLYSSDGNAIKTRLDNGELDVGFLIEPVESAKYWAQSIPVIETWGLMMSKDAPLANRTSIIGKDLLGIPLLGARRSIVIDQVSTWLNIDPDNLTLCGNRNLENNVMPLITRHGYFDIAVDGMLDFYPNGPIKLIPFDPISQTGHTFIYRKNHQPTPIAQAFIDYVSAEIQTM
ncbi:LysR family transcriptional regulator [Companilactobacillus muriivasis]|uniref:LysR family transcriptional regulator n=1 Tax=Companilactobacillus muriivasis TaxID=3081444 RepID=UPI0030C769A8